MVYGSERYIGRRQCFAIPLIAITAGSEIESSLQGVTDVSNTSVAQIDQMLRCQLTAGNVEEIGPEIGYIVTVLPEGSPPDLVDAIRQLIDEAQREAEESLEEFLAAIEEEIERRIEEELGRIDCCGQPVFGILVLALVLSKRKRKSL
jgi:hypothetical protein